MKRMLTFTFLILSYNIFLLLLPVLIFLASINFAGKTLLHALPVIWGILGFFSPVLIIYTGYLIVKTGNPPLGRLTPVIMNFIGYSPFLLLFFLLGSFWSLWDYFLIFFFPVLLGLIANLIVLTGNTFSRFESTKK